MLQLVLNATIVGLLVQMPSIVLAAMLSDRVPRVRVMIAGGVSMAVDAFVFLALLGIGRTVAVYVTIVLAYAVAPK